jgi:hypothetical protein
VNPYNNRDGLPDFQAPACDQLILGRESEEEPCLLPDSPSPHSAKANAVTCAVRISPARRHCPGPGPFVLQQLNGIVCAHEPSDIPVLIIRSTGNSNNSSAPEVREDMPNGLRVMAMDWCVFGQRNHKSNLRTENYATQYPSSKLRLEKGSSASLHLTVQYIATRYKRILYILELSAALFFHSYYLKSN